MTAFINDHRGAYGVEPICKVLPIAPSTYHEHVARRTDPGKLSARAKRDLELKQQTERVFGENFEVYGARKVWRQMLREGFGSPADMKFASSMTLFALAVRAQPSLFDRAIERCCGGQRDARTIALLQD